MCTSDTALYYLDDIGISLVMAGKAADEKYANGKALVNNMINLAWNDAFNDVKIDGFQANKVLQASTIGVYSEETESGTGFQGPTFNLTNPNSPFTRFYLGWVKLKVSNGGHTIIQIVSGSDTIELYNGTPADGDVIVKYHNDWVEDGFQVQVKMDNIEVYTSEATSGCCGGHYSIDGELSGLQVALQVKCDKQPYLCQFSRALGQAVLYKAGARIWNEVRNSDRFNDYLNIKKDKAVEQMAWLDSTYNLLKYDPTFDNKHYAVGMYQQELEKISIPVPSCRECLECKEGYSYSPVSLP